MFGDIYVSALALLLLVVPVGLLGGLVHQRVLGGRPLGRSLREEPSGARQRRRELRRATTGFASTADELAELARLRDAGHLDAAEYEKQRARLLG